MRAPPANIPPECAEAEKRFQEFLSNPPKQMYEEDDLFDNPWFKEEYIEGLKEDHARLVNGRRDSEKRTDVTFAEAAYNTETYYEYVARWRDDRLRDADAEVWNEGEKLLRRWARKVVRLHKAVLECLPKVKTQLMGEQISRQTNLHPDVMKNIMEFANAKDPKRIVLDSAANRGVALPRAGRRRTKRTKRKGTSRTGRS